MLEFSISSPSEIVITGDFNIYVDTDCTNSASFSDSILTPFALAQHVISPLTMKVTPWILLFFAPTQLWFKTSHITILVFLTMKQYFSNSSFLFENRPPEHTFTFVLGKNLKFRLSRMPSWHSLSIQTQRTMLLNLQFKWHQHWLTSLTTKFRSSPNWLLLYSYYFAYWWITSHKRMQFNRVMKTLL